MRLYAFAELGVIKSVAEEPSAAPEQPGAGGDGELREQMAALVGVVRQQAESVQRQGEQIQRLQEALERQQAAAAAAAAAAPVEAVHPAPPAVVPSAAEGVAAAVVPVTMVPAGSGTSNPDSAAEEAERERALAALIQFQKFNPLTFEGGVVEPAVVESWIDSMETLFEDLNTWEKDKVYLATHCLEKAAKD
uniref:Uncharacterized protein n=1 Tax=Ananas comosus var. bracteatus TaxID=296719 RepID=A0A6V7QLZ0_ANACO|nr:unnamed protein product [Ananas comosus var. bracteatus]